MTLPTPRPFESFFPKLTPHERCIAEAQLAMVEPAHAWTSELTAGHWRLIQEQGRFEAEVALCPDPLLAVYEPRRKRHQPRQRSTAARSARSSLVAFESFDPLKSIPPDVYVEALTGEQVPANGYIRCPLPDHEDRTPSFQVLESHWRCFGCNRGGGIIDLGEYLYRRRRTRVLGAARPRF
jgi:CHC2 zinc finger